jgi:four helix bundle protein
MAKTYRELDIYKDSFDLFIQTHRFSMKLPKFELYELGSQLRRSSDSVNTNIVEGYGRQRYKKDFVRFLTFSHASNDETVNHLRKLSILYPEFNNDLNVLSQKYDQLGGRIYTFTNYVEKNWR